MLSIDVSGARDFFDTGRDYAALAGDALRTLRKKNGAGADFLGWMELPSRVKKDELSRLQTAARRIRDSAQALVVVGIGGSYLGARAGIELLEPAGGVEIIFTGNSLSPDDLANKLKRLEGRDFCVNVVSKSGTTLEPAAAFRVFRALAEERYGAQASQRIFATTDAARGALKALADEKGYECFTVPEDVGGRYSVLSAVGLLPLAAAGADIEQMLSAAEACLPRFLSPGAENPALTYAAARQSLYAAGFDTELLASYEPQFRFMGEWWKQLFGESEGKNGRGIFPAYLEYSADLHSMGQYVQQGPRRLQETVVRFRQFKNALSVPADAQNADGLNYLAGRDFGEISALAARAVQAAHIQGGVPNLEISVSRRDEAGFAELVCFFETACALSAYMQGVNPFDQPGVEAYKSRMFRLLGRP